MNLSSWFRRKQSRTSLPQPLQDEDDENLYGITESLIEHVKSFTVDTFRNFPLPDEGEAVSKEEKPTTSDRVRKDLSEWQEKHATLLLSKVKEMSQLRFKLCPRYLKERQFWRIYFQLVKFNVAEYEIRAVQLEKWRRMEQESEKSSSGTVIEVEMQEASNGNGTSLKPSTS